LKIWFTASELAALSLPGLPGTKRGINIQAARESWPNRTRSGRGGGYEYPRDALPRETREELAARDVSASAKATLAEAANAALADIAGLGGNKRTRAEARLCIVSLADAYRKRACLDQTPADLRFADEWNAGRIESEPWLREALPAVSGPSLRRWRFAAEHGDTSGLAGRYRPDRATGLIDGNPVFRDFIVALIAHAPHYRPGSVRDAMKARFRGLEIPSAKTLQRWMNRWREENPRTALLLENPDAAKNKFRPSFGSQSETIGRINQVWESDATPADVQCLDGRFAIVGTIDVFTRRARVLVARTSKSEAVLALKRRCILDWGKPETVKTDNGQEFKSRWVVSAFAALGIQHKLCRPFTPEGKPHIERFFGSMTRDLLETLPGYVGHNVAERQAIRSRAAFSSRLGEAEAAIFQVAMTAQQLQAALDAWLLGIYELRGHEGLHGATPRATADAHAQHACRIEDERALDVLLAQPVGDGVRVVGKRGLAIDNAQYMHPALVAHMGLRVRVLFDAADAGRVVVRDLEGKFVCVAEDPERTGRSRAELAAEATATARRLDATGRALTRELKRVHRPELTAGEVLDAAVARLQAAGDAAPLGLVHSSPALDEAAKAAAALEAPRGWEPKVLTSASEPGSVEPAPTRATRIDWDDVEDTRGLSFEQVKAAPDRVFFLWVHQNPEQAQPHHKELLAQAIAADPYVARRIEQSETITQERIENAALYGAKTRKAAAG
jgi:putative transposase